MWPGGHDGLGKEEIDGSGRSHHPPSRSARPLAGTMDTVKPHTAQWHCDHAPLDWLAASSSDPIMWRPGADHGQKRDPAAGRRKKGMTNQGPLQKNVARWLRWLRKRGD